MLNIKPKKNLDMAVGHKIMKCEQVLILILKELMICEYNFFKNNILNLMREKLTNREIGDELGYSESTIRQETMRIYQILDVDNRRQAAAFKFIED